MKSKVYGFTLIELVVVMVILGIMSAVAVPQFLNLKTQARTASLNGLAGALNGAVNIVRAGYFALGTSPAAVTLQNGTTVAVASQTAGNANEGIPDASANGIGNAISATKTATVAQTGFDYFWIPGAAGAAGTAYFAINASPFNSASCDTAAKQAAVPCLCYVTYSAATGAVAVVNTGC